MLSCRLAVLHVTQRAIVGAALAAAAAALSCGPARAQGKLEARYTVSIAGVPIGRGTWITDISDDQYATAATGRVTGILRAVTSGEGSGAARGLVNAGRLVPVSYAAKVTSEDKSDEVRIGLTSGTVKELFAEPPTPPNPDRVPVTDEHRRGIIDPLTAGLVPVSGAGELLVPEACRRTLPVFDGRQRYDLALSFKRMENVKAERGYRGPVVVCMVVYQPLAGHRPSRSAVRYLAETRDIELWLAPIAGTRVLAPFRISFPTLIGTAVLEATQFMSSTQAPRPTSATNAKTQ